MTEFLISFFISLSASRVHDDFKKIFAPSLDKRFQAAFKRALKIWNQNQQLDLKDYDIKDYWDLMNYLDPSNAEVPSELHALAGIWIKESMQDAECAHFLTDKKLDIIIFKQKSIETRLNQLLDRPPYLTNEENEAQAKEAGEDTSGQQPSQGTGLSESFRHTKDVATLTKLMETFSFDLLEEYVRDSHETISQLIPQCFDMWYFTIDSLKFKIYDTELLRVIKAFYEKWKEASNIQVLWYCPRYGTDRHEFIGLKHDMFTSDLAEEAFEELRKLHMEMIPLLYEMASYIQDHYEIDLDECALRFFRSQPSSL